VLSAVPTPPPPLPIGTFLQVLGGVLSHEARLGLVRCRVRRHRWHKGLLKANDPLVVSCGWRRFQTMPL